MVGNPDRFAGTIPTSYEAKQKSTINDPKVYRFDTKVDIVLPTKHCSTDPVISAFSSSHQHRLSSFVSALCSTVYFRVSDGTSYGVQNKILKNYIIQSGTH